MATEVLRDRQALAALRIGWEDLAERAGSAPMQDFAWSTACATTVDAGGRLAVVVVGGVEHPVALAPLVHRGGHLEILGATRLSEPSELLYEDEAALEALAAALVTLQRPLLLSRLPARSPTVPALTRALGPRGATLTRTSSSHAVILLDDTWTAPEGRLSPRRASDVRRARRWAEAAGGLVVELLAPGPEDLDGLLDDAFAIEGRGWKGRAGTALALDDARAAFFRCYAGAAAARAELRLAFLRIDGRRVAMLLAVEWRKRLWVLKIGHDESVARASPGTLLLLESVRDAARRGLDAVQLLGGIEPWTRMWTADEQPCVTALACPVGVGSIVAALGQAALGARGHLARRRTQAGTGLPRAVLRPPPGRL